MNRTDFIVRPMEGSDWDQVASVIHDSTNAWYTRRGLPAIFSHGFESTRLFCEVYEALDPGCCLVAEDCHAGRIAGSCFYHPRPTHVGLGIMNVHPDCFGRGVAGMLLEEITRIADARQLPIRLVSSAINLDSFSLYSRAGFVPQAVYQDILFDVPAKGLDCPPPQGTEKVRPITADDIPAMVALEQRITGIQREKDFRYFLSNDLNIWNGLILLDNDGSVEGFLHAVRHPASNMLGPGIMRTVPAALALVYAQLGFHRNNQAIVLSPASQPELIQSLYRWGGRNCELHLAQIRECKRSADQVQAAESPGECVCGITIPTFMPETG